MEPFIWESACVQEDRARKTRTIVLEVSGSAALMYVRICVNTWHHHPVLKFNTSLSL